MRIFEFESYKDYLLSLVFREGGKKRHTQTQLANAIDCQSAYLTQILRGKANLSLEQGLSLSRYLNHNDLEHELFLSLILLERASTQDLQEYLKSKIMRFREEYCAITCTLGVENELSLEQKVEYYSSWKYSVVHMLVAISRFQKAEALSERAKLDVSETKQILNFLLNCGLISSANNRFSPKVDFLHLHDYPALVRRYNAEWRLHAIRSLDVVCDQNLHYSCLVSLSTEDAARIKRVLVEHITGFNKIVRSSPSEELFCIAIDWFKF